MQEKLHEALKYLHVLKKRIKIDHKPSSNSRSNHQDRKTSASRVQVRAIRARPCKPCKAHCGTACTTPSPRTAPPRYHHYTAHALTSLPCRCVRTASGGFAATSTSPSRPQATQRTHRVILGLTLPASSNTSHPLRRYSTQKKATSRSTCGRSNESRQRQARRVRHAAGQRARAFGQQGGHAARGGAGVRKGGGCWTDTAREADTAPAASTVRTRTGYNQAAGRPPPPFETMRSGVFLSCEVSKETGNACPFAGAALALLLPKPCSVQLQQRGKGRLRSRIVASTLRRSIFRVTSVQEACKRVQARKLLRTRFNLARSHACKTRILHAGASI